MDPTYTDEVPDPDVQSEPSTLLSRLEFVPPPESPPPEYASLETRAKALAIDALLALGAVVVLAVLQGGLGGSFGSALTGVPFLVATVGWFIYMTLMEGLTGASVGKRVMKLRVVSVEGSPISLEAALIRNGLRILDAFPYVVPYLVGTRAIRRSPTKQRLGDQVAETVVIVDRAPVR
ncbi:MAG TPA: RDD family protein [Actinomycetota bacterium]